MKIRDSGMPVEALWSAFFDPIYVFRQLHLPSEGVIVDLGCGYGTFAIPAAQMTHGIVYAFDIEEDMIATCREKAESLGLENIIIDQRDFLAEGTGLDDGSVGFVMLFNILHAKHPVRLLRNAHRLLRIGGKAGIIHWNYDSTTPRGPDLSIRPRPKQCINWIKKAGFTIPQPTIDLPPFHYGIIGVKK